MYQRDTHISSDLPDASRLLRSTLLALATALVILVTIVLPAEYAIDPVGAGRVLGLTEMGEIKGQLAEEAAAEEALAQAKAPAVVNTDNARLEAIEKQLAVIANTLASMQTQPRSPQLPEEPADRQPTHPVLGAPLIPQETIEPPRDAAAAAPGQAGETAPLPEPIQAIWRDEVELTLKPGQGVELKLAMKKGAEAEFQWTANGSVLNFDTHGDGGGRSTTYEKGRGVGADAGILKAEFDGNHGWFWRNRTDGDVTLTLRVKGDYLELKRLV